MYKVRNKIYAEAGNLLRGSSKIGYYFVGEYEDFTEEAIRIDDMAIQGSMVVYNDGKLRERYSLSTTYEEYKARFVKKLYSNDDQIAIMLNKGNSEEDDMLFEKMQQWRDWCGKLAKAIVNLK